MIKMRTIAFHVGLAIVLAAAVSAQKPAPAPKFQVDPAWPKDFPNNFVMGSVTGVFVDAKDHIWITHLPETLTEEELGEEQKPPIATCCKTAPTVIELDAEGNVRAGLGAAVTGHLGLSAQRAWHLRRSHRPRLDRHVPCIIACRSSRATASWS